MPMTPRCQPSPQTTKHRLRADVGVGVHLAPRRRQGLGFFLLATEVLLLELLGQVFRLGRTRLVGE